MFRISIEFGRKIKDLILKRIGLYIGIIASLITIYLFISQYLGI